MEYFFYALGGITIIILLVILIKQIITIKKLESIITTEKQLSELSKELIEKRKEYNLLFTENQNLHNNIQKNSEAYLQQRSLYTQTLADLDAACESAKKAQAEKIDANIANYYLDAKTHYEVSLSSTLNLLREEANKDLATIDQEVEERYLAAQTQLAEIRAEIDDWSRRRQVVNEEISRTRAVSEHQDFYRINLDDDSKADIEILLDAKKHLNRRENLDKLIYDGYIAKPTNEMIKRVLNGDTYCGIYKITRLKTGEIYIGKSTDAKARWQQHVKTVFGVGTIAHSTLHTTMAKDGVDQFTFEKVEECDKSELSTKEKFYIELYNSKNYGMNERNG